MPSSILPGTVQRTVRVPEHRAVWVDELRLELGGTSLDKSRVYHAGLLALKDCDPETVRAYYRAARDEYEEAVASASAAPNPDVVAKLKPNKVRKPGKVAARATKKPSVARPPKERDK